MNTLEKIDIWYIPFQKKHPTITKIAIYILIAVVIVLFIPLCILFIIGSVIHSCFYTGVIYKKTNNKPERVWI